LWHEHRHRLARDKLGAETSEQALYIATKRELID
jgi:hypothetical protein